MVFRCSHQFIPNPRIYRCPNSRQTYRVSYDDDSNKCDMSFSSLCPDDPRFFQICAHKATNCRAHERVKRDVNCNDFICQTTDLPGITPSQSPVLVSGSLVAKGMACAGGKAYVNINCTNYNTTDLCKNFNSTYSLLKCRNQSIVYWLKDGPIFKTPNFSIGTLMATITKKTSRETTPVNDQKGNGLLKNAMDQLGFDAVAAEQYYPFLPEYGFQSNTVLINAGFKESGIVYDGHSSSDEFLYVEFYNYPKVEESSLSYRLIGEDGAHSFYEGLLLVSFNTVDEEGRVKEVFGDGMVCQKSISVEVLERACEKMGFSKLLYHGSAAGYSSADSFNFTIGIGFKGLAFHYKTGNGDCVNKSEAIVVECGFDLAPNASFGNLTFNLVEESYSIPSDPLLASDWVPPRYRDPMAGYLLVTVSVLGNISTGMVCSEGVSEATKTAMCLRMGFHTSVLSKGVSMPNKKVFLSNVSYSGSWGWNWEDCPESRALWLECRFDPTLCKPTMENGYMVFRCSHPSIPNPRIYRCPNSRQTYRVSYDDDSNKCDMSFSSLCPDDPRFFQICAHKATNCRAHERVKRDVNCNDFICQTTDLPGITPSQSPVLVSGSLVAKGMVCAGGKAYVNINCTNYNTTDLCKKVDVPADSCYTEPNMKILTADEICNERCFCPYCDDEINCTKKGRTLRSRPANEPVDQPLKRLNDKGFTVDEEKPTENLDDEKPEEGSHTKPTELGSTLKAGSLNCTNPMSGKYRIVPINWICDGVWDCRNGEDEPEQCSLADNFASCGSVNLTSQNRCGPEPLENSLFGEVCPANEFYNHYDCDIPEGKSSYYLKGCLSKQLNHGKMFNVNRNMVCSDRIAGLQKSLCDDKIDTQCVTPTPGCTIHKHQLCDDNDDCNGYDEELNIICGEMTEVVTYGFDDCYDDDGSATDEHPEQFLFHEDDPEHQENVFVACTDRTNTSTRYVDDETDCDKLNEFRCYRENTTLDMAYVCDRVGSCASEVMMCAESRNIAPVEAKVLETVGSRKRIEKRLGHCLPGLESMRKVFPHLGDCEEEPFHEPFDKPVDGVTLDHVIYPAIDDSISCQGVFDRWKLIPVRTLKNHMNLC
eukprot:sb/3461386/